MVESTGYIRGFDGLRALAVSLVLAAHSNAWEGLRGTYWFDRFVYPLVLGENGVLIFFVLSGFLITHLLIKELSVSGTIKYRHFIIRRVLRLLPAFTLFWLTLLGLTFMGYYDIHPASFAFAGLYLYNFVPKHFYSGYFGLTWSLGVEEQFYLLWPLWLRWEIRRSVKTRLQTGKVGSKLPQIYVSRIITGGALTFIALSLLFMISVPYFHLPEFSVAAGGEVVNLSDFTVERVFFPYRWFIPMGSYLLIGCAVAAWAELERSSLEGARWLPVLAALLFLTPWFLNGNGLYFPQKLLQSVGFGLLTLWVYYRQQSWITGLLETRPLRHIGRLSYGLYLYSGIFLATGINHPEWWWQHLPLALGLTYLTALLSYFTVERFFLKQKSRFTPARL